MQKLIQPTLSIQRIFELKSCSDLVDTVKERFPL